MSNLALDAHEPDAAFYTISESKGALVIEAEFPWSLRNALIEFDPSLENASEKETFEDALFRYVSEYLLLRSVTGDPFKLISIEELPNNGHSHQSNFKIIFEGEDLGAIENLMLCNLYTSARNYHYFGEGEPIVSSCTQSEAKVLGRDNESIDSKLQINLLLLVAGVEFLFMLGYLQSQRGKVV